MLKASFLQWELNNHATFITLQYKTYSMQSKWYDPHRKWPCHEAHHDTSSLLFFTLFVCLLDLPPLQWGLSKMGFETHLAEKEWVRTTSKPFSFFVCFALFCLFVCFLTGELPKCLWFGISSSVDISTQVVSGSHSSNPVENFLGFSFPYFGSSLS